MYSFLRIALPLSYAAYILVVFVFASYKVKKSTGKNPFVFGKSQSARDYIGKTSSFAMSMMFAVILIFSFFPSAYNYLNPFERLETDFPKYAGLVLFPLSFIWIVIAQKDMSDSWRIGIDDKDKTELISKGVFGISRNPVFLGMLGSAIALFLMLPNSLTLLATTLLYFFFQIQIRLEEEYLLKTHGEIYMAYCAKVRRWI